MLKPFERQGIIIWDKTNIETGSKWREELETALASAKVALLLVSPEFLASDSIREHEMLPLLEAAQEEKGLTILWVYIRSSMYKETEIKDYTPAHDIEKPLADLSRSKRDKILVQIGERIKKAVEQQSPIPPSHKPHYDSIIKYIMRGKIVPFLGPEINLCDRPDTQLQIPEQWKSEGPYPPTQDELAAYIDGEFGSPFLEQFQCPLSDAKRSSLPDKCPLRGGEVRRMALGQVSQYIDLEIGIRPIHQAIQNISQHSYDPNKVHKFLAKLPKYMRDKDYPNSLKLIVTANFDSTLEQAFKEANQPFDLVYYFHDGNGGGFKHQQFIQQPDKTQIVEKGKPKFIENPKTYRDFLHEEGEEGPVILKLYGPADLNNDEYDNFVITEDHYINYLVPGNISIPSHLLNILKQSHIWFLGYSLNYWNQRVILHRIWGKERKLYPWWAIESNPTILEKKLWKRNSVVLIDRSLEYYIDSLDSLVEEIPAKHLSSSTRRT